MNASTRYGRALRGALVAGMTGSLLFGAGGCKSNSSTAPIVAGNGANAQNPAADGNLAPYTGGSGGSDTAAGGSNTQVMGASQAYGGQSSGEAYYDQQSPAPIVRQQPAGASADEYTDAEEAGEAAIADTDQAPPPLPEYDQPPAPDPNYLWTPGYWNYAASGYYWVPGAWVAPPYSGALWTPPWWGWHSSHWYFHRGYWGPHIGFYGGVNYGFGYVGTGYFGGYWRGRDFVYNRAVTNVNPGIVHNFYDRPVVYNGVHYGPHPTSRVSYNGGRGGLDARPGPAEIAALHEPHFAPVAAQREMRVTAAGNRGQFFADNHGHPASTFAGHPVGNVADIPARPHEQPFNHPGTTGPAERPGAAPGFAAGHPEPAPEAHPGVRPGTVAGAPPNRPGVETNHAAPVPRSGFEPNRNGPVVSRPGPEGSHPMMNARPGVPARPAFENNRPAASANRPAAPAEHPAPIERPGFTNNHPAPAARPAMTPHPATRPEVAHPAPVARPESTPHPAPMARPAPAPRPVPAARPAPAPHAGGAPHGDGAPHAEGGEHHH